MIFLKAYCRYYISKHLAEIIRSNPQELYALDSSDTRELIDYSLNFLVDQK